MDNTFYRLTDIMTIVKADDTIFQPEYPEKSKLENSVSHTRQKRTVPDNALVFTENKLIEKDFMEDGGAFLKNVSNEVRINRIKRYQKTVKETKERRGFKCQICGKESFTKDDGRLYCEAHHIEFLSLNGSQDSLNIIILCANHHRMFHYAKKQIMIGPLINGKREIAINQKTYVIVFD